LTECYNKGVNRYKKGEKKGVNMKELNQTEQLKLKKCFADFLQELEVELCSNYNYNQEDSLHYTISFDLIKEFSLHYNLDKQKILLDLTLDFLLDQQGIKSVETITSTNFNLDIKEIVVSFKTTTASFLAEYESEIARDDGTFANEDINYYFDKGKNNGKGEE
jgi:hypothetical protein